MTADAYAIGLHTKLEEQSESDPNDELKGQLLPKQASLVDIEPKIVFGSAGEE